MIERAARYGALLVLLVLGCRGERLALAALSQTPRPVRYDGSYFEIPYPGGDVPDSVGVCTDVVIRAYRKLGTDLQREVHEDIEAAPDAYGRIVRPDPSIDHRRVANLCVFLQRRGASLPVSSRASDYRSGDIVTWLVPTTEPGRRESHIGIVVTPILPVLGRPLVCHHIAGRGPRTEDVLFAYHMTGHYRWLPR